MGNCTFLIGLSLHIIINRLRVRMSWRLTNQFSTGECKLYSKTAFALNQTRIANSFQVSLVVRWLHVLFFEVSDHGLSVLVMLRLYFILSPRGPSGRSSAFIQVYIPKCVSVAFFLFAQTARRHFLCAFLNQHMLLLCRRERAAKDTKRGSTPRYVFCFSRRVCGTVDWGHSTHCMGG